MLKKLTKRLIVKLGVLLQEANQTIARETLPRFANHPKNLKIDLPRRIINPDKMVLGDNIWLGPGSFLNAITSYPTVSMQHPNKKQPVQEFNPRIIIGNRVTATAGLQVAAHAEIIIEDDVLFASNINLTDGLHGYQQANEAYKYQPIFKIAPILIKQGCWIGQNVVILPGVTIGQFAIVGANSVVTKNIPDRCIAAGAPARVIKRWDQEANRWISVDNGSGEEDESLREIIRLAGPVAPVSGGSQ